MPNWVIRPVMASRAKTMRCSCRHEVLGKAGANLSRMGKISGMGFRGSVVVWVVPTTSFRKPYSHSSYARNFGEGIVNRCAYWDYQRDNIYVRSSRRLQRVSKKRNKKTAR